jgi:hypothetical protein
MTLYFIIFQILQFELRDLLLIAVNFLEKEAKLLIFEA